jgi:hypothetical protein
MRKREVDRAAEAIDERLKDALGTSIGGTGTSESPPAPPPRRRQERRDETLPGEPDPRTTVS